METHCLLGTIGMLRIAGSSSGTIWGSVQIATYLTSRRTNLSVTFVV